MNCLSCRILEFLDRSTRDPGAKPIEELEAPSRFTTLRVQRPTRLTIQWDTTLNLVEALNHRMAHTIRRPGQCKKCN